MTQQEINEGNQLIMQFLKWEKSLLYEKDFKAFTIPNNFAPNCKICEEYDSVTGESAAFHESFDWLMPVIEKLYRMDETDVKGYDTFNDDYLDDIRESFFDINISGTYETVVNAIKWFNKNK